MSVLDFYVSIFLTLFFFLFSVAKGVEVSAILDHYACSSLDHIQHIGSSSQRVRGIDHNSLHLRHYWNAAVWRKLYTG